MALIKCEKCGVKYNEKADVCPCCGAENKQKKNQKRVIIEKEKQIKKEGKQGKEREGKKKQSREPEKKEMSTLAFIAFLAVLCIVVFVAARKIMQGTGNHEKAEKAPDAGEIMEQYLEEEKYQELYDYYQGLENYNASYQKYWEVGSTWNWMKFMYETKEALDTPEESYYGISYALSGCAKALMTIDEAVNDGTDLGNEEILKGFQEDILGFLREDLKLSEEEIGQVAAAGEGSDLDWDAMEASVLEGLNIK